MTTILWYILTISKYPVDFVNKPKKIMVRRVKFSLRGECKRKEKAEKISLNFPHRENCCFPITMKNNIFISIWISYPLRSWYVFARAISNQTTVNLEVTVFHRQKHTNIRILLSKASKDWLWCIITWAFIFILELNKKR